MVIFAIQELNVNNSDVNLLLVDRHFLEWFDKEKPAEEYLAGIIKIVAVLSPLLCNLGLTSCNGYHIIYIIYRAAA